jgi:hypothetical protein
LAYFTEINNLTPFINISFKVPFSSETHLQSFGAHFWKPLFGTSLSGLVTFALTSSVLANHYFFRTLFVIGTRKRQAATSPGNMADASKPSHCASQGTFYYQRPMCRCVVVEMNPAASYPFLRTFPSHCIPRATEDFNAHSFIYSISFWNKFIVDETLNTKERHQPATRILIDTRTAFTKKFMAFINSRFYHCRSAIRSFK